MLIIILNMLHVKLIVIFITLIRADYPVRKGHPINTFDQFKVNWNTRKRYTNFRREAVDLIFDSQDHTIVDRVYNTTLHTYDINIDIDCTRVYRVYENDRPCPQVPECTLITKGMVKSIENDGMLMVCMGYTLLKDDYINEINVNYTNYYFPADNPFTNYSKPKWFGVANYVVFNKDKNKQSYLTVKQIESMSDKSIVKRYIAQIGHSHIYFIEYSFNVLHNIINKGSHNNLQGFRVIELNTTYTCTKRAVLPGYLPYPPTNCPEVVPYGDDTYMCTNAYVLSDPCPAYLYGGNNSDIWKMVPIDFSERKPSWLHHVIDWIDQPMMAIVDKIIEGVDRFATAVIKIVEDRIVEIATIFGKLVGRLLKSLWNGLKVIALPASTEVIQVLIKFLQFIFTIIVELFTEIDKHILFFEYLLLYIILTKYFNQWVPLILTIILAVIIGVQRPWNSVLHTLREFIESHKNEFNAIIPNLTKLDYIND